MKKIFYILISALLLGMTSCSKEDLGESAIAIPDDAPKTEIDIYIHDNFTVPYNVGVLYKWVDGETEIGKNLVPPSEDKIIPFLKVIKKAWIEPYVDAAGQPFLQKLMPKQIQLFGSASYNNDGTIVQGTAEGGRKLVLYEINSFNPQNRVKFKRFIHVMHHEFGHIMHQTVLYPDSWKTLTPQYTSTWANFSEQEALNQGFITPYSMNVADDDFVEMIATYLTNSKAEFDAIIARAAPKGQEMLRTKEQIVINYMWENWHVDMPSFRDEMTKVMDEVINGNNE